MVLLWLDAARHAYETGDLEPLAKLFRSGAPLPSQVPLMLADMFDSCKLMRKSKGGQRKLFAMSAAAQKALGERMVRRLESGEFKLINELLINELSTKELVWQAPWGKKVRLKGDAKSARAWNAIARELSNFRDAKGRMPLSRAIGLTARALSDRREGYPQLKEGKLARWVTGKTGARQRHRTAQKKRPSA